MHAAGKYEWVDRKEILTYEEITRLARIFISLEWRRSALREASRYCAATSIAWLRASANSRA